ncbi:Nif3-like dinuclear metal center hexameric protein [Faecalimonas sp.]
MLCKNIVRRLEELYPSDMAFEWDNVGLLVGRKEKEVKRIYVALDLTEEILVKAIEEKADMIVTHHPMIFSPLRTITDEDFIGRRVVKLLQHDIAYFAMHTNYDVMRMADLSADILNLKCQKALERTSVQENLGIGKIGVCEKEMTLSQCAKLVKENFHLDAVQVFGKEDKRIQKIAVCAGSGKSVISVAIDKGADVLVTGDIGHHEGIDAIERNLAIIDAGHYGLEYIFIKDVSETLIRIFPELSVKSAEIIFPSKIY